MFSRFNLLVAFLGLVTSISEASLEAIPSTSLEPPAGISIQVLSIDGGNLHVGASATFFKLNTALKVNYTNFNAHTDTSVSFFQDHVVKVVFEVTYPDGASFYVHDAAFEGNGTLESRGAADIYSYTYFGPSPSTKQEMDIDQANLTTVFTGDYGVGATSNSTRLQHAPCNAGSVNFTIITELRALGGILTVANSFPATVDINLERTAYKVSWTSC